MLTVNFFDDGLHSMIINRYEHLETWQKLFNKGLKIDKKKTHELNYFHLRRYLIRNIYSQKNLQSLR